MASKSEVFSSRWGMLLAMLGMAVGTGNIWRFPRMAATWGGGSFLVPWAIFLIVWSVPLLILEFAMGKATRQGTIGAFIKTLGPKFAWMGAWVALVATAIMFYYSVVMGWTIRYFIGTLTGAVPEAKPGTFWNAYNSSGTAVLTHLVAMSLGVWVVYHGVKGIEKAAKILMPTLLVLVVVLTIKAVTLPGASRGLAFLFTPHLSGLMDYHVWLQALTQNAWDTGAGWGLVLTYSIYMRKQEDTALNAFVIGFGNNSVSLMAGIMVLCTVFSVMPGAAHQIVGAGNEGLTFIWIPQLLSHVPAGRFFQALFFLALVFAAWTSLVAMIELAARILMDLGMTRKRAIAVVGIAGFLLGVPSALNLDILHNQDWVWGVALMISGLFFAIAVLKSGVTKWREKYINHEGSDIHVGRWWDWLMRFIVVEAVVLTVWLIGSAWVSSAHKGFKAVWTLFSPDNVGTLVIQWAVVLVVLLLANGWLVRAMRAHGDLEESPEG